MPSVTLIVELSSLAMLPSEGMAGLLAGRRVAMAPKRFCVVADDTTAEQPMTAIGLDRELTPYRTLSAVPTDLD